MTTDRADIMLRVLLRANGSDPDGISAASDYWAHLLKALPYDAYVLHVTQPTYRYASDRYDVAYYLSVRRDSDAARRDVKRAILRMNEPAYVTVTSCEVI